MRTPPTRAPQFIRTQVTMTASPKVGVGAAAAVGDAAYNLVSSASQAVVNLDHGDEGGYKRPEPVSVSLQRMKRDMDLLDDVTSSRSQLTNTELFVLTSTVAVAAGSPFVLPVKLVEVLVPSMAALSAAIGLSAEYVGKTSVARGKEIAAVTLQAAAEAEVRLAQAERAKAVVPLCVGVSATASAFALLAPALLGELAPKLGVQIITEVYLICPLLAALGAAVAALATAEATALASSAVGLCARRFASSGTVGRSHRPTASARAPPTSHASPPATGGSHVAVGDGADRAHLRPRHPEVAVVLVGRPPRAGARRPHSGAAVLQGHRRCRRRRRPVRLLPSEG